ncbi:hypothetical protein JI58_06585 [Marinosulfonomonas sp. PRT-SC04]|nr:hypothetical protein JI58_06585 [Marinosulfonomonas sp. PRT-SC04]
MTKTTKIQWTDYTVNFWEGCQKVGPGCDNCYAEARDVRFTGGSHWGAGAPRRKVKNGIPKLRKINQDAEAFKAENGHWPNVFCSSLSDVFDNAVDPEWRREAFTHMVVAPNTRIQLLTKRIGNVEKMTPAIWTSNGWPHWVGLMITVVNQAEADRDIPKLLDLKERLGIPWVGLSIEPMQGPIDLTLMSLGKRSFPDRRVFPDTIDALKGEKVIGTETGYDRIPTAKLDWVICGGESGPKARPMHPDWARALRDQCVAAGAPFFFKQWGEWTSHKPKAGGDLGGEMRKDKVRFVQFNREPDGHFRKGDVIMKRVGKAAAGRLLDGREWNEMPEVTGCV